MDLDALPACVSFTCCHFNSILLFRVLNSTAVSGVTSPLEENELASFRFIVVNIDGTDVFGSVLFQYVVPQLTSVPENQVIAA